MNNDLISREALKKRLQDRHDFWVNAWGGFSNMPLNDKSRVDELSSCIAEVVNAPAVEAVPLEHHNKIKGILDNEVKSLVDILDKERPKGEWIFVARHCYKCPFCQELSREGNFCPNCGADMRKESRNEI